MRKRQAGILGQSLVEFVVLLGSAVALTLALLAAVVPSVRGSVRAVTECVISDVCSRNSLVKGPTSALVSSDDCARVDAHIAALLQEGAEICAAMRRVTVKIYDSAGEQVGGFVHLGIDVLGSVPELGTAIRVVDALIRIETAMDALRPINEGVDQLLDVTHTELPFRYAVVKDCTVSLASAYSLYQRGRYGESLDELAGCVVGGTARLAAGKVVTREVVEKALRKELVDLAGNLVDSVYNTFKDATEEILAVRDMESLKAIHERLVRELGRVNLALRQEQEANGVCSERKGPIYC